MYEKSSCLANLYPIYMLNNQVFAVNISSYCVIIIYKFVNHIKLKGAVIEQGILKTFHKKSNSWLKISFLLTEMLKLSNCRRSSKNEKMSKNRCCHEKTFLNIFKLCIIWYQNNRLSLSYYYILLLFCKVKYFLAKRSKYLKIDFFKAHYRSIYTK